MDRIPVQNMPARPGVYRLWNTVAMQSYIGASRNMLSRAKQHSSRLRDGSHPNRKIQRSYEIHGSSAFRFEVMEECDLCGLLLRERELIRIHAPAFNFTGKIDPLCMMVHIPVTKSLKRRLEKLAESESRTVADIGRLLWREAMESRKEKELATSSK